MKKVLVILMLMAVTGTLFAQSNNKTVGTVKNAGGDFDVISTEKGTIIFSGGGFSFTLSGASQNKFMELTAIHLELMDKVQADTLDVSYRRIAGRLITEDFRRIYFQITTTGKGYEGCFVDMTLDTPSHDRPIADKFRFTGDDLKMIRGLISEAVTVHAEYLKQILELNEIVDKTKDTY